MASEVPLSLVVRATDKFSATFRALSVKFEKLKNTTAPVGEAFKNVGSQVTALAQRLTAVTLGAGVAFGLMVKGAMDAGDRLGEVASRVGLTVDAFASLEFAAAQSDVSADSFASSMDKLNKQMGDMTVGKGGEFLAFLREVGPGFAEQMKGAKTTEQAMALLTDAFSKIDDPQRRATLAAHAFGKSNLQMGEWLHQGSAAIQEQQRRFMELTGSQEEFAKNAGELDNATRETETAFLGLRNAVAGALFPALTELAKELAKFMADNREGLREWATGAGRAIKEWLADGGLQRLIADLRGIAEGIGKVVDFLGPWGVGIAAIAVVFGPLIASVATLGVELFALAATAAPAAMGAIGGLAASFAGLMISAAPFLLAIGGIALAGKAIYDNWGDIKLLFTDAFSALKWAAVDAWAAVKPLLEKLASLPGIGGAWRASIDAVDSVMPAQAQEWNPAGAAPRVAGAAGGGESRVVVDFNNMPKGTRVTSDANSSQPVDLSLNYSMVTP